MSQSTNPDASTFPHERSFAKSEAAFLKSRQLMPGGVSSPVRAFKAVGGTPVFLKDGDTISIEIERIGKLTNPVVDG